jgi:phenylacetate-CoA ligase
VRRGTDGLALSRAIADGVKSKFELAPHVVVLETGTLAKEFEANIKASRFVDRR